MTEKDATFCRLLPPKKSDPRKAGARGGEKGHGSPPRDAEDKEGGDAGAAMEVAEELFAALFTHR